ncbi:MAG: sn-glycerol-3-phosphate ABC transporter ATP-binding protein UgpC [Acholeplasmataceae bacterium]|nr:sn-glycerol-3-phosphate ABC transporter ATP-binding protein UgpC [Acholeplasmataceae bacterium]
MAKIILKNINKIYPNGFQAIHDFNLEVDDGEFIIFVGPSGCGKSTTLRMIAGLEEITKGEMLIDGKVVNSLSPKQRGVAMVFQSYALYPHLSVYENLAFGLNLEGLDEDIIEEKVLHTAKVLGLEDYLDRKPRELSGGQCQRVAVGRAIIRKVNIFLMDEPLSNLDAKQRVSMRAEIVDLHRKIGSTTIYVTHDQTEAITLADKIVCMSMGYIQQVGTPLELYDKPNNLFVANFIGLPPMNLIDVNVSKEKLVCPYFDLPMDDNQKTLLKDYIGKGIVLGIRPEDIHENGDIPLKVKLNENLGQTTLVHGHIKDKKLVCKFKRWANFKENDVIQIGFNPEKLHFFDKDTTMAIR